MTRIRFNSSTLTVLAGLCAATLGSHLALAANVGVPMDQVRMITFRAPFKTVYVGNPVIADITIIDPDLKWTYQNSESRSKSRNSPFDGWDFHGGAVTTIVGGRLVFGHGK